MFGRWEDDFETTKECIYLTDWEQLRSATKVFSTDAVSVLALSDCGSQD